MAGVVSFVVVAIVVFLFLKERIILVFEINAHIKCFVSSQRRVRCRVFSVQ